MTMRMMMPWRYRIARRRMQTTRRRRGRRHRFCRPRLRPRRSRSHRRDRRGVGRGGRCSGMIPMATTSSKSWSSSLAIQVNPRMRKRMIPVATVQSCSSIIDCLSNPCKRSCLSILRAQIVLRVWIFMCLVML